jgi:hydroxyacylglutathione hydrolase
VVIEQILALEDNYAYLLEQDGITAVVDPSEAEPVFHALGDRKLDFIFNTHHHWDHTGGNLELKEEFGCEIVGAEKDRDRIPGIDITVAEGDPFILGSATAQVIEIPGHTSGHIAFWFPDDRALFCGDTLFSYGCGRNFEGDPPRLWESLKRLAELPDDTLVYCGHEYTEANLAFAVSVEPDNELLKKKLLEVKRARSNNQSTVPSLLKDEKEGNPFLRAVSAEAFAKLRREKDHFRV